MKLYFDEYGFDGQLQRTVGKSGAGMPTSVSAYTSHRGSQPATATAGTPSGSTFATASWAKRWPPSRAVTLQVQRLCGCGRPSSTASVLLASRRPQGQGVDDRAELAPSIKCPSFVTDNETDTVSGFGAICCLASRVCEHCGAFDRHWFGRLALRLWHLSPRRQRRLPDESSPFPQGCGIGCA